MLTKREDISVKEIKNLIRGCLAKDRFSQKRIYDMYSPSMMALCLRYCSNREEAEEVLQDGFCQVYKNISQFQFRGSFEGWLRRIMINCALQRYRNKINDLQTLSLSDREHLISPKTEFVDRLGEKELINLIQTLPNACRMVFNLYVFDGLKHREIADLLNITEGTSKSNLSDARQILKKHLIPELNMAR